MKETAKILDNDYKISWCPGCPNHRILDATKIAFTNLMSQGFKYEDFVIVAGIGCHGKIFDYLNVSGFNALHGRDLPTALGIKIGNPNLNVLVFAGDGDCYSEGMSHFVHSCKYNLNLTLLVHDNQSFSLTTGQATPTSQIGYKTKIEPLGKFYPPTNPIRLALCAGATFIARANARDTEHTAQIIEEAMKHKGFSFVEVIQDCIVFNTKVNYRDKMMYKISKTPEVKKEAFELAEEYDYNEGSGKIPIGIFWKENRKTLEEGWPQLQNLLKQKIGWKGVKR